MEITLEQENKRMERNGCSLDLRGTGVTTLPDNLTVGCSLDLRGTVVTTLPVNLTVDDSSISALRNQISPSASHPSSTST